MLRVRCLLLLVLGGCASLLPLAAQTPPPLSASPSSEIEGIPGEPIGEVQPLIDRWNRFLRETAGQPDAVERIERYRKEHGVPLSFWEPDEETPAAPPRYAMGHPCGGSATVFVIDKIFGKNQPIHGDQVYELDKSGKILHEWMIQIDNNVAGIEGDQILVSESFELVAAMDAGPAPAVEALLSVRGDGAFQVLAPRKLQEPVSFPCPSSLGADSAYMGCWVFRDLKTKKERRLAMEGPCT